MPTTPTHPTPEEEALKARATAARELLAKLGMKRPALWEMRAAVAALGDAEERGAARERALCWQTSKASG